MNDDRPAMTLYGTSGCHLCELAEVRVRAWLQRRPDFAVEVLDIAGDDALFARYGLRIPVLRIDGAELDWPFDAERIDAALPK